MASTYSSLKIELIGSGDQSGTWGSTTNTNLGTALEEAIVGSADVSFSSSDVTLTLTDTNASQTARNLRLNLTGTSGGARNLIVPAIEKFYVVNNGLADAVTVKNSTGSGIAIPAGKTSVVYNTGSNVVDAVTFLTALQLSGNLTMASATSVVDANGNELIKFPSTVASAVNEVTVSNAATGANPSIAATGGDTDVGISFTPKGAGDVVITSGNLRVPSAASVADSNGNELIKFPSPVASAVNEITVTNAATGSNPTISATGGDTNISLSFAAKGTGAYNFAGTTDTAAEVRLFEDADNGSNYVSFKAPATIASNVAWTLPNADGTSGQVLSTNGSGTLSWASAGGGGISTGKSIAMAMIFGF
jgi:hypothetical protein